MAKLEILSSARDGIHLAEALSGSADVQRFALVPQLIDGVVNMTRWTVKAATICFAAGLSVTAEAGERR